ncbi:MAG: arginine N-succinyltransferase [Planctomycetota bacterium]
MWTLRAAQADDLPGLVELAGAAGPGLTTFPADADRLAQRLAASAAGDEPLLVLCDPSQQVRGVSGLVRRVGDAARHEPFYAYRLERTIHHSDGLGVRKEVEALHLVAEYDGPSEVGTLFLHPDARGGGLGRLLSLGRFLLMANNPEHFQPGVIAELRGVVDGQGQSPFWDALGSHFFGVSYADADARSSRDKRFIAELMPTHPIYVPLLPESARSVIGRVHPNTAPAKRLLESEGFYATNLVDIFDAGPAVRCDVAAIRTVRRSRRGRCLIDPNITADESGDTLACRTAGSFVAVRCYAAVPDRDDEDVHLSPAAAKALGLQDGEAIRVSPLRG